MNTFFPTPARSNSTWHLMVDIETLATHPQAPILAIGAVLFDPTQTTLAEPFGVLIDPADAVNVCGPVDGATLKWWFEQDDKAIKRLVGPSLSVRDALTRLWAYSHAGTPHPTHIWAKGPDFDCAILQSACKAVQVRYPFPFWKQRDVRTAVDLAFPNGDTPSFGPHLKHDARDDAVHQARLIQACYAELGLAVQDKNPATAPRKS